jgi:hypothetical protein
MRIGNIWRLIALTVVLLVSPCAWAVMCRPDALSVTEDDMLHPPPGMVAFRAEILKILPHGRMNVKPHRGFAVDYRIVEMYRGAFRGNLISVEYGGCQSPPGHVGEVINVLAMQDSNVDWFAPEFWTRNE